MKDPLRQFFERSWFQKIGGVAAAYKPILTDEYGFVGWQINGGYLRSTIDVNMTVPSGTYLIAPNLEIATGVTLTLDGELVLVG